jgi:hypothetical protein
MLKINRFCEPCFELLVEKSILQRDGYERVKGQTLFDIVTEEMIEATTERANDKHRVKKSRHRDDVYYTPFFDSGSELSWQAMNKDVDPDDIAIVVANSLIQEGCRTRYLQLDGIHYNDPGFGQKGYKALALALSINTVVERIDFYHDRGEGCCCDIGTSYAEDISNGLFLKALQHNRVSALKELPRLCPQAFGPHTWEAWKKVKPNLECGPEFFHECYDDVRKYVTYSDDEDY